MNISGKRLEKLVKGCIDNDRKAQEELYKLFYADMLRVCLNYLPDDGLAREAFNAGFLKVFQSIRSFDIRKGELGGWIRKIMIYTAIDLFRQELKFERIDDQPLDTDDFFIPPEALERLQFADILTQVRTLPYATQTVFNLSVIDGFSHKEISEQLNISEGTSRWHLAEAKSKLRVLLQKADQNAGKPKERSEK
ncbi:RNA polymerase sigma-70 factor (ECF subfamily) [Mucilaginibacter yixingensis]|uniref:RNA polymerase sigma-70 factor (ECF subfamily) n=1 Tax=Mucilaginibacter yixingensis TaxID=1295612 RepID=A0A2T5JD56_9SPHI|nr:sigma-70 family RNA polymerase sigma factor [Mucilaginibacter yixingensis]PTQ99702.1 RNA polymerase sigma-70 factor (ECF subfamily) [Mucilaginibacter yixingensis]